MSKGKGEEEGTDEIVEKKPFLRILSQIVKGNNYAQKLDNNMNKTIGIIQRQLKKLEKNNIVRGEREKHKVLYTINYDKIFELLKEYQIKKLKQLRVNKKLIRRFKRGDFDKLSIDAYRKMLKKREFEKSKDMGTDILLKLVLEDKERGDVE